MKYFKFKRAVLVAALVSFLSFDASAQLSEYPEWFLFPREFPEGKIGVSFGSRTAEQDAEIVFTAYKNCIVDGVLRILSTEDISFPHRQSDYFYYYSENSLNEIAGRFVAVDSMVTNLIKSQSIAIFQLDSGKFEVRKRIKTSQLNKPDWVNKTVYKDGEYFYAIGAYTSRGNENDSWKTAEERAIFSILLFLNADIKSETIIDNTGHSSDEYKKVIEFKVKQVLREITVLERYPDATEKINYVFLRLKAE
jgi:hypothetical protein